MAARKRKSPEKKKPVRQEPGLVSLAFAAAGRTLARHPRTAGGSAAFVVVFSFVAANALWYQPGAHPSPFLRTRDAVNPAGIAGYRPAEPLDQGAEVTTFRIEREGEDTNVGQPATAPASGTASAQPSALVAEIQQELAKRGLYEGKADGVLGPRTTAAILFFEDTVGMEQTGEPTNRVLSALKIDGASVSAIPKPAIPKERPSGDLSASDANIDPVAAAIRKAEPAAHKPGAMPVPAPVQVASVKPPSTDLIAKIQRGLVNIAYADVTVDGVAGQQTKAAIRHFEKHYRLPETGEPSEAVLQKLKAIGAL